MGGEFGAGVVDEIGQEAADMSTIILDMRMISECITPMTLISNSPEKINMRICIESELNEEKSFPVLFCAGSRATGGDR